VPAPEQDLGAITDRLISASELTPEDVATLAICQHGSPRDRIVDALRLETAGPLIVQRSMLYQPATPEVQTAMRARCNEAELRLAKIALAERLKHVHASSVRAEAVQHLLDAGAREPLARLLTTYDSFQLLMHRNSGEVARTWQTIGMANISERYQALLKSKEATLDLEGRTGLLNNIGLLMGSCGLAEAAERFLRQAVKEARAGLSPKDHNFVTTVRCLALFLAKTSKNRQEAETLLRELLDLAGSAPYDFPVQRYQVLSDLADLLVADDRYEEALTFREG
jgi:hypothetical protein